MRSKKRQAVLIGVTLFSLLFSFYLSVRFGSTTLSSAAFFGGLFGRTGYENTTLILFSLRLPRALGALLAGAGLALSGALLQRATDNPLAAPHLLGINAGAGFFVILSLFLFPAAFTLLPFAAFLGATLTALLILGVCARLSLGKSAVVLCGVAFSALFGAGISFLSLLDADVLAVYTDFSIGGLRGVAMRDLYVPAPIIALCLVLALILSKKLHLLSLGDTLAASLGVRVRRVRFAALLLAAASAAAAVSFAGLLGFVGLIVPHVTRRLSREDTRTQLWLAPAGGGVLLLLADLAGRVLLAPTEIPVGIFTALLGVPFFLILLFRRKRHA